MISMQELGDYSIADEDVFDVQTITDAMMSTSQSMMELMITVSIASPYVSLLSTLRRRFSALRFNAIKQ